MANRNLSKFGTTRQWPGNQDQYRSPQRLVQNGRRGNMGDFSPWLDTIVEAGLSRDIMDVAPGELILTDSEPDDRIYIVQKGTVKIGYTPPDAREIIMEVLGPSDIFGEMSVFDPGSPILTATSLTTVRLLCLDQYSLRILFGSHPIVAENILLIAAQRLRRIDAYIADMPSMDVAARVARMLLDLGDRFGVREPEQIRVRHHLTQKDMAQYVGATRETVNKVISEFSDRGWIHVEGKSVFLLDPSQLARRGRVRTRSYSKYSQALRNKSRGGLLNAP